MLIKIQKKVAAEEGSDSNNDTEQDTVYLNKDILKLRADSQGIERIGKPRVLKCNQRCKIDDFHANINCSQKHKLRIQYCSGHHCCVSEYK